jgi:hypothetical protein
MFPRDVTATSATIARTGCWMALINLDGVLLGMVVVVSGFY